GKEQGRPGDQIVVPGGGRGQVRGSSSGRGTSRSASQPLGESGATDAGIRAGQVRTVGERAQGAAQSRYTQPAGGRPAVAGTHRLGGLGHGEPLRTSDLASTHPPGRAGAQPL